MLEPSQIFSHVCGALPVAVFFPQAQKPAVTDLMNTRSFFPSDSEAELDRTYSRIFDSTRGRLFRAWVDPLQLALWWGPRGFTNPVCELDVRPGGTILIHMHDPEDIIHPMTGAFLEISEPEELIFTCAPLDRMGRPYFEALLNVTFTPHGDGTHLSLRARIFDIADSALQALTDMDRIWSQSFDRLASHVSATASSFFPHA